MIFRWFRTRIVPRVIGMDVGGLYPADEETAARVKGLIDSAKDKRIDPVRTTLGTFFVFTMRRVR